MEELMAGSDICQIFQEEFKVRGKVPSFLSFLEFFFHPGFARKIGGPVHCLLGLGRVVELEIILS
jgi:hypothetical protein